MRVYSLRAGRTRSSQAASIQAASVVPVAVAGHGRSRPGALGPGARRLGDLGQAPERRGHGRGRLLADLLVAAGGRPACPARCPRSRSPWCPRRLPRARSARCDRRRSGPVGRRAPSATRCGGPARTRSRCWSWSTARPTSSTCRRWTPSRGAAARRPWARPGRPTRPSRGGGRRRPPRRRWMPPGP